MANGSPRIRIDQGKHTMEKPRNAEACLSELFATAGYTSKDGHSLGGDGPEIVINMGLRVKGDGKSPRFKVVKVTPKKTVELIVRSDDDNSSKRRYYVYPLGGITPKAFFERLSEAASVLQGDLIEETKSRYAKTVFKNKNVLRLTEAVVSSLFDKKKEVQKKDITDAIDSIRLGVDRNRKLPVEGRYALIYLVKNTKLLEKTGARGKYKLLRHVDFPPPIHPVVEEPIQEEPTQKQISIEATNIAGLRDQAEKLLAIEARNYAVIQKEIVILEQRLQELRDLGDQTKRKIEGLEMTKESLDQL